MRSCDHAIIRILGPFSALCTIICAQSPCNWNQATTLSVSPENQTTNKQQVCVSLRSACPGGTLYNTFVGYTVEWNDGSLALTKGIDLANAKYEVCMAKYNDATYCKYPFGSDQYKKYPPMRSFQECHTYATPESHLIGISLTTLDQSEPAQYAFGGASFSKPWTAPPPPPDISPLGYCPIPRDFAIHASSYLYLNDYVNCTAASLPCKTSAGTRATLGVNAHADQLWTPTTWLRSNSRIEQLFTNSTEDRQMGASWGTLAAYQQPRTHIPAMPSLKTGSNSATVEAGKTVPIKAGTYNDYVVRGKGTLRLQGSGSFSFNSLHVESDGILEVAHGNGTIEVYAKSFLFRGLVRNADATRFLVGVVGAGTVYVDNGFTGSIWAPWSHMVLGQSNTQPFRGTFMANTVTFHQKSIIEPVTFIKNQGCTL